MKSLLFWMILFTGFFDGRVLSTETKSGEVKTTSGGVNKEHEGEVKFSTSSIHSKLVTVGSPESSYSGKIQNQDLIFPSQSVVEESILLQNLQVTSELSATSEAVVLPSADSVVQLQNKVKSQELYNENIKNSSEVFGTLDGPEYVVHAEPKLEVQPIEEKKLFNDSVVTENELERKSSQEETKKTAPQHEDIPSFSEWTQKQLAEAEKKKSDQNETSERLARTKGKFRNKNYASPDCGAKIVASNPESLSSSAVLSSLKDEYMLNYCTNRIWFVVELCEAIQAKQLDLANFELFSSSPKHFSVSLSLRFPTREWSDVGKFTAQDSRDVQTFNLHPHLFGKFVKVELHSHYGREQFCPISWVGVYGTSEYEVLAKEDDRHSLAEEDDQFEDYLFVSHRKDSPKNLFSSATDAVLSIVKKATAPFMKSDNNETKSESVETSSESSSELCVSPRFITVCNNCSQAFYDEVFRVISCRGPFLEQLLSGSFVKRTLIYSEICKKFGLDFNSLRTGALFPFKYLKQPKQEVNYLTVMLGDSSVGALCNFLAVLENKVVVNATIESSEPLRNLTGKESSGSCELTSSNSQLPPGIQLSSSSHLDQKSPFPSTKISIFEEFFTSTELVSKIIEPTKTLTEDEVKMLPSSGDYPETSLKTVVEKSTEPSSMAHVTSTATLSPVQDNAETLPFPAKDESTVAFIDSKPELEKVINSENKTSNASNSDSSLDSILNEIKAIERVSESPSSSVVPSSSNLPAESIFLRLANRIKNLEINMSLSSTYLEELSKRYRVQLELLSKSLNLTIQKMEEQSKVEEERLKKREKEIAWLRLQLANLTRDVSALLRERNSWRPRASTLSQHVFFISVEILILWMIFTYRKRSSDSKKVMEKTETMKKTTKKSRRRISLEGVGGHQMPGRRARRPSDEALEIALSRTRGDDILKLDKKKKRRKRESKCSVGAVHVKRKKSEERAVENLGETWRPSVVSEEVQVPEFGAGANIEIANRFSLISSPKSSSETNISCRKTLAGFPSPTFIRTALAARNSRLKTAPPADSSHDRSEPNATLPSLNELAKKERKTSNGLKKYMKKFF